MCIHLYTQPFACAYVPINVMILNHSGFKDTCVRPQGSYSTAIHLFLPNGWLFRYTTRYRRGKEMGKGASRSVDLVSSGRTEFSAYMCVHVYLGPLWGSCDTLIVITCDETTYNTR